MHFHAGTDGVLTFDSQGHSCGPEESFAGFWETLPSVEARMDDNNLARYGHDGPFTHGPAFVLPRCAFAAQIHGRPGEQVVNDLADLFPFTTYMRNDTNSVTVFGTYDSEALPVTESAEIITRHGISVRVKQYRIKPEYEGRLTLTLGGCVTDEVIPYTGDDANTNGFDDCTAEILKLIEPVRYEDKGESDCQNGIDSIFAIIDQPDPDPDPYEYPEPCINFLDSSGKPIQNLTAKYIEEKYNILHVSQDRSAKPLVYVYNKSGYYEMYSDARIKGLVRDTVQAKAGNRVPTSSLIGSACTLIESSCNCSPPDIFNRNENIINFKSCILDISTMRKERHSPQIMSTIQIGNRWSGRDAPTPKFDALLDNLATGEDSKINHAVRELILEWIGFTISNIKGYKPKKSILLVGAGNSGKSVMLNLIRGLIGEQNSVSFEMDQLSGNDKFALGSFADKRFAFCPDASFRKNSSLEMFKSLIGGDTIAVEMKGKDKISLRWNGVIWIASNTFPKFGGDTNDWVYDRFIPIEIFRSVPESEINPNLETELVEEYDGIIYKAIQALGRFVQRGYRFDEPQCVKNARERHKVENSTSIQFWEECIVWSLKNDLRLSSAYSYYCQWCADNNFDVRNKTEFQNDITRHAGKKNPIKIKNGQKVFENCYSTYERVPN